MATAQGRRAWIPAVGALAFAVWGLIEATTIGRGYIASFMIAIFLTFVALWAWSSGPDDTT